MGNTSGQMGSSKGGFFPKTSGFSSRVGKGGTGQGKLGKAASKPGFIKSPRQAQGSKGDGMNGGY